ncbi:hypothetical protein O6H91_04G125700 [Diphasiastrum complanatum]|uniref:Uncharacterized protein n=1 Tax=Diphasiastrum complanatum TaxID=34168 RepID=A0ACC2E1I9_DIPCM|nr:hypothetical protein O6H91_04G125700 [Diphasiastrum complanatum]
MGKVPIRLKDVIYTLSPFNQQVMAGLWHDLPHKLHKKISENWLSSLFLITPVVGTYWYAEHYKEQEKLHHRF